MYFVESGTLRYFLGRPHSTFLRRSLRVRQTRMRMGTEMRRMSWCCELALWVQDWQNRGDLVAIVDSSLLALENTAFAKLVCLFPVLSFDLALHARCVVRQLEQSCNSPTDLWRLDDEPI